MPEEGPEERQGAPDDAADWSFVEERDGEQYTWPQGPERYDRFWVYRAPDGHLFAVGRITRTKEPSYWVTFVLGADGGSKRPVVVFNATDDHDETGEAAAIIRGKTGGKAMFDPEDRLPAPYRNVRIETHRDRIAGQHGYSFDKAAVIAHRDDHVTMLRHARAQVKLRGLEPAAA